MFKVGDRVKRSDVDEESIPAFRDMRGWVVEIWGNGAKARVRWDGEDNAEFGWRDSRTITIDAVYEC